MNVKVTLSSFGEISTFFNMIADEFVYITKIEGEGSYMKVYGEVTPDTYQEIVEGDYEVVKI